MGRAGRGGGPTGGLGGGNGGGGGSVPGTMTLDAVNRTLAANVPSWNGTTAAGVIETLPLDAAGVPHRVTWPQVGGFAPTVRLSAAMVTAGWVMLSPYGGLVPVVGGTASLLYTDAPGESYDWVEDTVGKVVYPF